MDKYTSCLKFSSRLRVSSHVARRPSSLAALACSSCQYCQHTHTHTHIYFTNLATSLLVKDIGKFFTKWSAQLQCIAVQGRIWVPSVDHNFLTMVFLPFKFFFFQNIKCGHSLTKNFSFWVLPPRPPRSAFRTF